MGIEIKTPVPRDFEISQSANLKPVAEIAKETGILEHELEPYGLSKAKVESKLDQNSDNHF